MVNTLAVNIERYDTRLYSDLAFRSKDGSTLRLYLIQPQSKQRHQFPLLIYIGGGGWRTIHPERHLPELTHIAELGFVVASMEYHTTYREHFPVQIEDVKNAIRYLRSDAEQLGINKEKVFLAGGSAGAYLAVMSGLTGGTGSFRGSEYLEESDDVSGVIGLYGIYNFRHFEQLDETSWKNQPYISRFLPNHDNCSLNTASADTYSRNNQIPVLLIHGLSDHMVPYSQSVELYDQLEKDGHWVQLVLIENADHADVHFSQPAVQKMMIDFLQSNL